MGVDCRIMLPGNVRVRDVMAVMAVAVGFKPTRRDLPGGGFYTKVEGVTVDHTYCSDPSSFFMRFDGRQCYFTFESDSNPGGRLLMPKSTAFWCLVGQRLVDFFGGKVDYNDCDDNDFDYRRPNKSSARNAPTNGNPWEEFQTRLANVKPITRAELQAFTGNVGYLGDGYEYAFDDLGRMVRGDVAEVA